MDVETWRDHMHAEANALQHITPDEVPAAIQGLGYRDNLAKIVAEYGAEDAKYILRIDDDIYSAVVDYVKPRWPELF